MKTTPIANYLKDLRQRELPAKLPPDNLRDSILARVDAMKQVGWTDGMIQAVRDIVEDEFKRDGKE